MYNACYILDRLKAVFQLRVLHSYEHARKSLNINVTFEMNKCFNGENSAFPTS